MARVLHERSAGGVLLVPFGTELMVALIELRGGTVLALPKGHVEAGETLADTARRETHEETGLLGEVIAPLDEIAYWFYSRERRARIAKRVAFFLLVYRTGAPSRHNAEVEGVRLAPLAAAEALLSYDGERSIMRTAESYVTSAAGTGRGAANGAAAWLETAATTGERTTCTR